MRIWQGVRTGSGHGGIACVLQTQFSSFFFSGGGGRGQKVLIPTTVPLQTVLIRIKKLFKSSVVRVSTVCHLTPTVLTHVELIQMKCDNENKYKNINELNK